MHEIDLKSNMNPQPGRGGEGGSSGKATLTKAEVMQQKIKDIHIFRI